MPGVEYGATSILHRLMPCDLAWGDKSVGPGLPHLQCVADLKRTCGLTIGASETPQTVKP
eukprot:1864192-Amphidinium_carterae.1